MQFQHNLPEVAESPLPPLLPGHTITSKTLASLRLSQLRFLARAYGIEIDQDAPKDKIMPAMQAAESAGVFKGEPKSKKYLWLSQFNTDHPPPGPCPYEDEPMVEPKQPRNADFLALQKLCRKYGISPFGMTVDAMEEAIAGHLAEKRRPNPPIDP